MFQAHEHITVLTFTNNVLANFFSTITPLVTVKFDNGERGIDTEICGMRVVVTQNRDKQNNV